MKSFKKFKAESYSRVDEGLGPVINKGLGYLTGTGVYDIAKPRDRKGNPVVKQTMGVATAFPKTAAKAAKFIAWDLPKAVLGTAAALKGR